jgi:hypothetical protein
LESRAGFMYRTLGLRSEVGLGLLESTMFRRVRRKKCFAAYYARCIDELSGRTTGRLGHIRPDTAHALGGTAELALLYSNESPHPTTGPRH